MAPEENGSSTTKGKEPLVLQDKAHWSDDQKSIFLDICIEQVRQGGRPNTSFDKCGW